VGKSLVIDVIRRRLPATAELALWAAVPLIGHESAALAWTLYQLESPMMPMALALADTDSAAYMVLLAVPAEEVDALAEIVFFPAVDALAPME
jgi:hypothetical protein